MFDNHEWKMKFLGSIEEHKLLPHMIQKNNMFYPINLLPFFFNNERYKQIQIYFKVNIVENIFHQKLFQGNFYFEVKRKMNISK